MKNSTGGMHTSLREFYKGFGFLFEFLPISKALYHG